MNIAEAKRLTCPKCDNQQWMTHPWKIKYSPGRIHHFGATLILGPEYIELTCPLCGYVFFADPMDHKEPVPCPPTSSSPPPKT